MNRRRWFAQFAVGAATLAVAPKASPRREIATEIDVDYGPGSYVPPKLTPLGISFERDGKHSELVAKPDGSVHIVEAEPPKFTHLEIETGDNAIMIGTANLPPEPLPGVDGGTWSPPLAMFGTRR